VQAFLGSIKSKRTNAIQPEALLGNPEPKPQKPPHFPMKFRQFLRRMFGGRLHSERLHLYRKYLHQSFQVSEFFTGGHVSEASRLAAAEKKTDEHIAKQSAEGICDPNWYFTLLHDIKRWRGLNRLDQRKKANKSRWLKETRKKLLTVLQNRIRVISQAKTCSLASTKRRKSAGSHLKK
jgi:hypothetical protein